VRAGWLIEGCAVFAEGGEPVRLDYRIGCDERWETRFASVEGWVGGAEVNLKIEVGPKQRWVVNGNEAFDAAGCIDIDLNFSPSTNLLPIRRLNLGIGEQATVRAAWVRFPSFRVEALAQSYRRIAAGTYEYESGGGQFQSQLRVDTFGLPLDYAGLWTVEASA
jgi:hypothetical protein